MERDDTDNTHHCINPNKEKIIFEDDICFHPTKLQYSVLSCKIKDTMPYANTYILFNAKTDTIKCKFEYSSSIQNTQGDTIKFCYHSVPLHPGKGSKINTDKFTFIIMNF